MPKDLHTERQKQNQPTFCPGKIFISQILHNAKNTNNNYQTLPLTRISIVKQRRNIHFITEFFFCLGEKFW
jgi:hypothetical protein